MTLLLPPSSPCYIDEEVVLQYRKGTLYIGCETNCNVIITFINTTVKQHLLYHGKDTANIILQLALLLQNKSMSINLVCKHLYDIPNNKFHHIRLSYDSVLRELTVLDEDEEVTFTYYEHKHKKAIEAIFYDFYFVAGYKLAEINKQKGKTIIESSMKNIAGTPPPSYTDAIIMKTDTEKVTLKYINGYLQICRNTNSFEIITFINSSVKKHLLCHSKDTAEIILQLALLLQNKSMAINLECKHLYDIPNNKFHHIRLSYDNTTRQLTIYTDIDTLTTFTYCAYKHKQAIEDMFNDFYFVAGHRLASANKFKQLTADIITSNPEITTRKFIALL